MSVFWGQNQVNHSYVAKLYDSGVLSSGDILKLYRAVSFNEYNSIVKRRVFLPTENSLEGKFFAECFDHARQWGDALNGSGKYFIVQANIPRSMSGDIMRWSRLDGIGPARYLEPEQLKYLEILDHGILENYEKLILSRRGL